MLIFPLVDYLVHDRIMTLPEGLSEVYLRKSTCWANREYFTPNIINFGTQILWHQDAYRGHNVWVPDWHHSFGTSGGLLWSLDSEDSDYAIRSIAVGQL